MPYLSSAQWHVLSSYLDQALEMTPSQRAVWLPALRKQNPALVEELEMLLREHDSLSDTEFLDPNTVPLLRQAGLAGQKVGDYRVISQIGQGGMGSVWLAQRDDGRFERRVAVKFLSIALMGRSGEHRFKQEGRILGRLTHPHIAGLLDSGVTASGQPYLVLEYADGDHIDQYCDRYLLDIGARIRLFLDVLTAVSHAHSTLVVHRDIKPSNVLVTREGHVKLLDFGIAKLLGDEAAGNTLLTLEGVRPLTPEFAAPEQLQGEAITTATDVYGLGVLLYMLLTGRHPLMSGCHSAAELVKATLEREPVRPSAIVLQNDAGVKGAATAKKRATTPERLSRALSGDLDTIILKALKKSPQERYLSAPALADDLRRYLRDDPIHARPDTVVYHATKFIRRHRIAVLLTLLTIITTAAGVVGTLVQWRKARAQCNLAVQQLKRKQAVSELNDFLLSDAAPSGKPFTVNELLGRAVQLVSQQHTDDGSTQVELLVSIGDQYSTQDEDVEARKVLEQAYKLSRKLTVQPIRAEASCALAGALARDGELTRAESLFQEGMQELPSDSDYDQERIFCLRRGSEVAQERGDPREGINRMEAAHRILRTSPLDSDSLELSVLIDLAEAYRMAGLNQQAIPKFQRAEVLLSSLGRDKTQNAVVLFNDWALALCRLGRPLEAEQLFVRAVGVSQTNNGDATVSPMVLKNYGSVLRELGRLDEATDYTERAYAKARQVDNRVAIYQAQYLLALIYIDKGDIASATTMLSEVEARLHQSFPPEHFWFGALTSAQALLASSRGDSPQASDLADKSVAIIETSIKNGGQGVDFLPIALLRRSTIRMKNRRYPDAADDASRALTLFQAAISPGEFSIYVGRAHMALGDALRAEGQNGQAEAAYRSATKHLQNTLGAAHMETCGAQNLAELVLIK